MESRRFFKPFCAHPPAVIRGGRVCGQEGRISQELQRRGDEATLDRDSTGGTIGIDFIESMRL